MTATNGTMAVCYYGRRPPPPPRRAGSAPCGDPDGAGSGVRRQAVRFQRRDAAGSTRPGACTETRAGARDRAARLGERTRSDEAAPPAPSRLDALAEIKAASGDDYDPPAPGPPLKLEPLRPVEIPEPDWRAEEQAIKERAGEGTSQTGTTRQTDQAPRRGRNPAMTNRVRNRLRPGRPRVETGPRARPATVPSFAAAAGQPPPAEVRDVQAAKIPIDQDHDQRCGRRDHPPRARARRKPVGGRACQRRRAPGRQRAGRRRPVQRRNRPVLVGLERLGTPDYEDIIVDSISLTAHPARVSARPVTFLDGDLNYRRGRTRPLAGQRIPTRPAHQGRRKRTSTADATRRSTSTTTTTTSTTSHRPRRTFVAPSSTKTG